MYHDDRVILTFFLFIKTANSVAIIIDTTASNALPSIIAVPPEADKNLN